MLPAWGVPLPVWAGLRHSGASTAFLKSVASVQFILATLAFNHPVAGSAMQRLSAHKDFKFLTRAGHR